MKTLRFAALVCAVLSIPFTVRAEMPEPFGIETRFVSESPYHARWARAMRQIQLEQEEIDRCRYHSYECTPHAMRFLDLVALAGKHGGRAKLGVVNREVNLSIIGTSDERQYGVRDYWAGPLETLRSSRGDCEDYAILKYAILRAAGIAADRMRIVVVMVQGSRDQHAVLLVQEGADWLVLDNERFALVRDADALARYMPLLVLKHDTKTAEH